MNRLMSAICVVVFTATVYSSVLAGTIVGARTTRTGTIVGARAGNIVGARTGNIAGTSTSNPRAIGIETRSGVDTFLFENITGILRLLLDNRMF